MLAVTLGGVPESVGAAGATVSVVQPGVTPAALLLPAASVAVTANVWGPSASLSNAFGELQFVNAAPSSEHARIAPDSALKAMVGLFVFD